MRVNEVLDFLYDLGCSYDIPDERMKTLCTLLGVDFKDLQKWVIQPPVKC
jgi:myosin heavy subunit